jgi:amidohydrolase
MREILGGVAQEYGGSFELDYKQNAPAVINDPALSEKVRPSLEKAVGKDNVVESAPTMGGEDFSYFSNQVPGFYFRLGVVKPGTTSGGLHTPDFRADDSAIPVGVRAMSQIVVDYLRGSR